MLFVLVLFGLMLFVLGEGEDVVVVIEDRELGRAIKGFFEADEDGDLVLDGLEEAADIRKIYIEQEGAAVVFAADGREGVAETLDGLEHHGYFSIVHHGPDERTIGIPLAFAGNRHGELEAEELIEADRSVDVFYEEVGSEGFHCLCFFKYTNIVSVTDNFFSILFCP